MSCILFAVTCYMVLYGANFFLPQTALCEC